MILKQNSGNFDEETARKFQILRNNVQQMTRLISDLLDFSRLERKDMSLQRVDMKDLIQEVWSEIVTINPGKKLVLKLEKLPT
jgi:signal transduction histidine kinase